MDNNCAGNRARAILESERWRDQAEDILLSTTHLWNDKLLTVATLHH